MISGQEARLPLPRERSGARRGALAAEEGIAFQDAV